jgi:hypothetical protein
MATKTPYAAGHAHQKRNCQKEEQCGKYPLSSGVLGIVPNCDNEPSNYQHWRDNHSTESQPNH